MATSNQKMHKAARFGLHNCFAQVEGAGLFSYIFFQSVDNIFSAVLALLWLKLAIFSWALAGEYQVKAF